MFGHWRRSLLKRARRAARSKRWDDAAISYREHLDLHPADGAAWVQLGHCLKEQAELHAASAAYRRATEVEPEQEDGWIHLAHIKRRLENREAAITTLEEGLVSNPGAAGLVAEMLALGVRDRLPIAVQATIEEHEGSYSLMRYGVYRAGRQKEYEKDASAYSGILPVIDARDATPEMVLLTRESLAQPDCVILTGGSVSIIGARLIFDEGRIDSLEPSVTHLLLIEAGSRVDPGLIQQLYKAMERTGAPIAYCDHDHWELTEVGLVFRDPCFQPMLDPIWFKRAEVRPPCMIIERKVVGPAMRWRDLFSNRMSLPATYVHVPLVLASRWAAAVPSSTPVAASPRSLTEGGIQVIIQTRDEPAMLERCVASLLRTARQPERIDIVVMDNRSVLPETTTLLQAWAEQGIARSIPHDEPFNWARANNVGVRLGQAPYLLFLNNDVEMESLGWDMSLRDYLTEGGVGAIGALLLYPNRLIQHGGVVLGMEAGGPVHEGVGHRSDFGGPCERWKQPRLASAVTGAWLATTRHLFNMVGGFEERLAVAYNDIDFCLRCRAAHYLIVQASDIIAIHRESATRGMELSPAEHAREQSENAWFRARWGRALDLDPAYNPHWVRTGQPFDGFSAPSNTALARWIEASARPLPWAI